MEFTLLTAALLAVGAIYGMIWYEAKRGNAALECARSLWDMSLAAILVGLVVGRVWAMVAAGGNPFTNPGDLLIVRAGVATGPAAVTALLALVWQARGQLLDVSDAIAPTALSGLAGWHAGCLARDACLGTASDLPWAVAQAGSSITRHPVELYTAALFTFVAVVMAIWKARWARPAPGVLGALGLLAAGAIRLVTEPMRPGLGPGPWLWYWAAVIVGIGLAAELGLRGRTESRRLNLT